MPLRESKWTPRESQEAYFERVLSKLRLAWGRAQMGVHVNVVCKMGRTARTHSGVYFSAEPFVDYLEPDHNKPDSAG